jgi:glycosyltransferase involved in cell wall biosynthesis
MKVLTVGVSPYLLSGPGRLHSAVLQHLHLTGYEVFAAAWNHDISYFMFDISDGMYWYEANKQKIAQIQPLNDTNKERAAKDLLRFTEEVQPNVIVSFCDWSNLDTVYQVKRVCGENIKWVIVLATGDAPIEDQYLDMMEDADAVVALNGLIAAEISNRESIVDYYCKFGPDRIFEPRSNDEPFSIICCARNEPNANLGTLLKAVSKSEIPCYLHVNIDDKGYYDIPYLSKRYCIDNLLTLPESYCSIKEGIPDSDLRDKYRAASVVVDVSHSSAMSLSVLEGMACGCVPILSNSAANNDILQELSSGIVPYLDHHLDGFFSIGPHNSDIWMTDPGCLVERLYSFQRMWQLSKDYFEEVSKKCIDASEGFCRHRFVVELEDIVGHVASHKKKILPVEVFTGK